MNDAADRLQDWLKKRCGIDRVWRLVILSHHSSSLGDVDGLTIDCVSTLDALRLDRVFARSSLQMEAAQIDSVVAMVRKDHGFHARAKERLAAVRG